MSEKIADYVAQLWKAQNDLNEAQNAQSGKHTELQARLLELEQKAASGNTTVSSGQQLLENPVASELIENDSFASIKAGMPTSGRQTVAQPLKSAVSNPGRGQDGDTAWQSEPNRLSGIKGVAPVRLSLIDVLPTQPVTSATVEYVALDGYVNGADYQEKEGDEKAEADLPTKMVRDEIATIAHWVPASLQVLNDNAGLQGQITQVLSVSLRQKLERELLVGPGGEGKILGLTLRAQVFAATAVSAADRIEQAITDLESAGWFTSVIVIKNTDWSTIRSERGEDGKYVLGSPRDPAPPSLWGRPVVLCPSMPAGKALLLDTSQTVLLDRQQVTVEANRADGNNFRRNLVTILAELRAGLAVYATSATRLVSLT